MADTDTSLIIQNNISYHDEVAKEYDSIMDGNAVNRLIRQRVKEKFCSLVPYGARVMDFGGGTGMDLPWLTEAGYHIMFCEPSTAMRTQAMAFSEGTLHSHKVQFLDGARTDFLRWEKEPPVTTRVDAVLSDFGPLNYIPDIERLFGNVARVVRPGGHFLLLVLHFSFFRRFRWHRRNALVSLLLGRTFRMYIPYKAHRQMIFVYTEKEIRKASGRWFGFGSAEIMPAYDFTLIHLVRNEKID